MATGPDHYREAEQLLEKVASGSLLASELARYAVLIEGHIGLAQAAAIAEAGEIAEWGSHSGRPMTAWARVLGPAPETT